MSNLPTSQHPSPPTARSRILVAYFSHTGNTAALAREIQALTGADLVAITPTVAYPADHGTTVAQAQRELAAAHRPALESPAPRLGTYHTVFIGSPNWWSTIAPPVMTFLESHDFGGKTVIPFITHEGSRLGRSVPDVKRLCPGAVVAEGRAFWGSRAHAATAEIRDWIGQLKLPK
ncbi:MAG: flavodoxin [Opitutaceae bacterium]